MELNVSLRKEKISSLIVFDGDYTTLLLHLFATTQLLKFSIPLEKSWLGNFFEKLGGGGGGVVELGSWEGWEEELKISDSRGCLREARISFTLAFASSIDFVWLSEGVIDDVEVVT